MNKANQRQYINVSNVLDWISKQTTVNLVESVAYERLVTDEICGNIQLQGKVKRLLWQVNSNISVSGNIRVCHRKGHHHMTIIINRQLEYTLSKAEEISISVHNLESIEVRGNGSAEDFIFGKYELTIHYNIRTGFNCQKESEINCFLSDREGNPIKSISCEEIFQTAGRKIVEVTAGNASFFLHKVRVVYTGFITIQLLNKGKKKKICTLPFQVMDDFLIFAPNGTTLKCNIADVNCHAYLSDDCKNIHAFISFYQHIQMVENTVIEVEARYIRPRER